MTEMDRLIQDLSSSPDLQRKLLAQPETMEAAVGVARDAGYSVTQDEVAAYVRSMQDEGQKELSDAQLDSVAGGKKKTGNKFRVIAKSLDDEEYGAGWYYPKK